MFQSSPLYHFQDNVFTAGVIYFNMRLGSVEDGAVDPPLLFFVDHTSLRNQVSVCLDKDVVQNIVVLSGPSGSGKTTLAKHICMANGWKMDVLDYELGRRSAQYSLDALVVDNLFSTSNAEPENTGRELAWLLSLDCKRILVTSRSPGAVDQIERGLSHFSPSGHSLTEFVLRGLPEELFIMALSELCCFQDLDFCKHHALDLFRKTGGLPIALQLVWNLASADLLEGRRLHSISDYSIEKLVNEFRLKLAPNDPDVYNTLFALANVPRFAISTEGLSMVLDWTGERTQRAVSSLVRNGLASYALPPHDRAVRIHDLLLEGFAARDGDKDRVYKMKCAHCAYWMKSHASESRVTLLDSLVVSSEILFSNPQPERSEANFLDGLRVMSVISAIIDEIADNTVYTHRFDQFSDWICSYIHQHYSRMQCHTVIPLALLCLRFPEPDRKVGEAFALFWETCDFDDPTIVASAVSVSAYHLGKDEKDRFKAAFLKLNQWRMNSREIVAASFASALARFGEYVWATYFVSGHNTGGVDYSEAMAGIAFALEQCNDKQCISRFLIYHGWRCRNIDPVTSAFLRNRIGGIGSEQYSLELEINMNRISFLAKLFSHSEFEAYADELLRRSEVISNAPHLHRVQRSWLKSLCNRSKTS